MRSTAAFRAKQPAALVRYCARVQRDIRFCASTHTAQIAALADCHLLIQKNIANERTYTEIHPLDEDGRVDALAHLISGDHVTELSRANAREMLEQTRNGR